MNDSILRQLTQASSALVEAVTIVSSLIADAEYSRVPAMHQHSRDISCFRSEMQSMALRLYGLIRVASSIDLPPDSNGHVLFTEAVTQLSNAISSAKNLTVELQTVSTAQKTVVDTAGSFIGALIETTRNLTSSSTRICNTLDVLHDIYKEHLVSYISQAGYSYPQDPAYVSALGAVLELAFCEDPFNMFTDPTNFETFLSTVDHMNSRIGPVPASIEATQLLGTFRVTDLMRCRGQNASSGCIDRVAESYVCVLEGLRKYLDADIDFLSSELSQKLEQSRLWDGKDHSKVTDSDYLDSEYLSVVRKTADKVNSEIERETERVFRVGICGMTKAGKSLFLNAIIGRKLLPTDELPSTALPCRIRHDLHQEPHLVVCRPNEHFVLQECIKELRNKITGMSYSLNCMNAQYNFVSEDDFVSKPKSKVKWEQLPLSTRLNWKEFRKPSFVLLREAHGEEAVIKLLGQVNDVARLCYMFDVELLQDMNVWPLLTVEFLSFIHETFTGTFEFFDLPGIDEATVNNFIYVDLIECVRKHVYAIVPVVSLKQISSNYWRNVVPNIVGTTTETPLIICTHLDQFADPGSENVEILATAAWRVFNPKSDRADFTSKCVNCSSLLGFGAQKLLRESLNNTKKPAFDTIYDEAKWTPEHECVREICGKGRSARRNYDRLTFNDWKEELEDAIDRSGIRHAATQFTTILLREAQSKALSDGIITINSLLLKILYARKSALQRLSRTREDCEIAKKAFEAAKGEINCAEEVWDAEDKRLRDKVSQSIEIAFSDLEDTMIESVQRDYRKEINSFVTEYKEEGVSQISPGRVRFDKESTSKMFLSMFQPKVKFAMELMKNQFIERTRRDIVDKQVTDQIDFLAQCLNDRFDGTQKNTIIGKVIAETTEIPSRIDAVPVSDLLQKCRQRVREAFEEDSCGKKAPDSYYSVIDENKVIDTLKQDSIKPLVRDLRRLAIPEFNRLMDSGRNTVESIIKEMLEKEDKDFAKELSKKDTPPLPRDVAASVAAFLNFNSAASAMDELRVQYEKFSTEI